ncbi:GntR family transcriptional regulator [Amycolatopsis rhizosphaerae]|uniref:GntR family transcriptional regulator n=1 Tax=Amycolatopsis rhizosphaerae TaxID=2053003 RepID=A0A558APV9_9PSEU|nr:GntR family transcriptional regulator [Amycolatopsis rhizosphaerae]TVT26311.1 GntR family transcriptional regulator [Amycolatopsis rhizosphaerae]
MQTATVYDRVRELIVSGVYLPGRPVTEQDLSERLEVSRTPVREALRRLESDGLVRGARRGVTVVELDRKALRDAYHVRASLEGLTAELAAVRQRAGELSPAALNRLVACADRADEASKAGDLTEGIRHNRAFHRAIALLAGNPLALDLLDRVWDQIIVSTRAVLTAPEGPGRVDGEHRALIAAITAGRPEAAAESARDHIAATARAVLGPNEGEAP